MASLSGTFSADGVSSGATGFSGNCDVSTQFPAGVKGFVSLQVSYDGGTTWTHLEGGCLGQYAVDRIMIAGDAAAYYRFSAKGVSGGSITYYLGQS